VEAAETLYGDYFSGLKESADGQDRVGGVNWLTVIIVKGELWAAVPAAISLTVETAIGRGGVLVQASRAEVKGVHGGFFAVVGDGLDDGVARAAVQAGNERMGEAAVVAIEKLVAAD